MRHGEKSYEISLSKLRVMVGFVGNVGIISDRSNKTDMALRIIGWDKQIKKLTCQCNW